MCNTMPNHVSDGMAFTRDVPRAQPKGRLEEKPCHHELGVTPSGHCKEKPCHHSLGWEGYYTPDCNQIGCKVFFLSLSCILGNSNSVVIPVTKLCHSDAHVQVQVCRVH